jgi:hypothetical protein
VDQLKRDSFLITHWNLEDEKDMNLSFSLVSLLEGTKEV